MSPAFINSFLRHWPFIRLLVGFVLFFFLFQWGYQAARGTVVERVVIDKATVKPSAMLINWLSPGEQVEAKGPQLLSPTTRMSVLNGCEGTEAWFLLIAAILAYRCSWQAKVIGLLAGTLFVYSLNQVRIVGLYFALRQDQTLFAALHGYIGPTLIVALICLFFAGWMQWSVRSPSKTA